MLKIALLLMIACVLLRWAFGSWPWQWAGARDIRRRELAKARRVLGVSSQADRTEVLAAHRLAMTRAHPDRGGSAAQVHEVDDARNRLLAEMGAPLTPGDDANLRGPSDMDGPDPS